MTSPLKPHLWPQAGLPDPGSLLSEIDALPSVYEERPRPFSFPGTAFLDAYRPEVAATLTGVVRKQYNLLGTHSRGIGGRWGPAQAIEEKAVRMVLSLVGADTGSGDGYFCSGGTEANLMGMWIGREWLRKAAPHGDRRIAVLATPVTHYSFLKGVRLLDLGAVERAPCQACGRNHRYLEQPDGSGMGWLPMNAAGEATVSGLERVLTERLQKGVRRFLLVLNVGATLTGSVDPVGEINAFCQDFAASTGAAVFLHVDACFGGFTLPFLEGAPAFGFEHGLVQTVAFDADKMGGLPYPAGIFLCRKGIQSLVENEVEYLSTMSHADDTLSGSRSAMGPMLAWHRFSSLGWEGQKAIVERCLTLRNDLVARLGERETGIQILPFSPWINIVALRLPAHVLADEAFIARHTLRFSFFPTQPQDPGSCPESILRVNVMPHHDAQDVEAFVDDLVQTARTR